MTIHKTLYSDSGGEEGSCEGGELTKCTVCGILPQTLKDLLFPSPSKLWVAYVALSGTRDIRSHTGKATAQKAF